ncbi:hypothetical protein VC562_25720, partial [Citrobacter freundii]
MLRRKVKACDCTPSEGSAFAFIALSELLLLVIIFIGNDGNDSNLLIVFYVQIMPDDFVMQLHR